MPSLFIGMPVFNGEKFISQAIAALQQQTFTDWILLISDNNSTDDTARLCQLACEKDGRISYVMQAENIGALNNFKLLLEKANTEYFMWAAADDIWNPKFLDACISGLEGAPEAGLAFSNIVNIDSFGQVIREYSSFNVFSLDDRNLCVVNYVLSPEIFGKANLIYGVYRLSTLKDAMIALLSSPLALAGYAGYDVAYNLGILCRTRLYLDERVLFKKRHARVTDTYGRIDELIPDKPYVYGMLDASESPEYEKAMIESSKGTEFESLVQSLMEYRRNLQKDINLSIEQVRNDMNLTINQMRSDMNLAIEQLYKEMAVRVEDATWKFARWEWLKNLLKRINVLRKKYVEK